MWGTEVTYAWPLPSREGTPPHARICSLMVGAAPRTVVTRMRSYKPPIRCPRGKGKCTDLDRFRERPAFRHSVWNMLNQYWAFTCAWRLLVCMLFDLHRGGLTTIQCLHAEPHNRAKGKSHFLGSFPLRGGSLNSAPN